MRLVAATLLLAMLAACGADDPPLRPAASAPTVTFGGSVQIGVTS